MPRVLPILLLLLFPVACRAQVDTVYRMPLNSAGFTYCTVFDEPASMIDAAVFEHQDSLYPTEVLAHEAKHREQLTGPEGCTALHRKHFASTDAWFLSEVEAYCAGVLAASPVGEAYEDRRIIALAILIRIFSHKFLFSRILEEMDRAGCGSRRVVLPTFTIPETP